MVYVVNVGRKNRRFATLQEAKDFCEIVFKKTGIVLSISAIAKAKGQ